MNEAIRQGGTIELIDRKDLKIIGVEDIYSFDDTSVCMKTTKGQLCVEGEGLRICDLSLQNGLVAVSGRIDGFYFVDCQEKKKRGLFGRKG